MPETLRSSHEMSDAMISSSAGGSCNRSPFAPVIGIYGRPPSLVKKPPNYLDTRRT
jgi:hypothetical protein